MQTRPKFSDYMRNPGGNTGYLLWLCWRNREEVKDPRYFIPSKRRVPRSTTVKTAVSSDTRVLEIEDPDLVGKGADIWMNERTKERFEITGKTETGVTVNRGFGKEIPAAPMDANDTVTHLVSGFYADRDTVKSTHIKVAERRENYTQRLHAFAPTLSESAKRYVEKVESAFLFGKKAGGRPEEHPVYSVLAGHTATNGIVQTIRESAVSNIRDAGGGLSLRGLDDFLGEATRNRIPRFSRNENGLDKDLLESEHAALCGKKAMMVLDALIGKDDSVQAEEINNRFGFEIKRIGMLFSVLDLLHYAPLDEEHGDHIILLDKERVGSRYLEGNDVAERDNGDVWEVSSAEGLWMENPELFGIIQNVNP